MIAGLMALWRAGAIARWLEFSAVGAILFLVGFAWGQNSMTKAAVESAVRVVHESADAQFRDATGALAEQVKTANKRIADDAAAGRKADDNAIETLRAGVEAAKRDAAAARVQLAKEKETNEGLRKVNAMLASDGPPGAAADRTSAQLCGDVSTRRLLDAAAGALDASDRFAAAGTAATDTASGADAETATGAATAGPQRSLTCDQLRRGYVNLAEWGRGAVAQLDALQQWVFERLLDTRAP